MTSGLKNEKLIAFCELARELLLGKGGRPIAVSTLHRWRARGVAGGIKLEAVRVGGRWCTSWAAFSRFNAKVTATKSASSSLPSTGSGISSGSSLGPSETPLW